MLVSGLSCADSYAYLDDWGLGALGDMGIEAWYQPLNDIAAGAGKVAGAAQKRMAGPDGGTDADGGPGAGAGAHGRHLQCGRVARPRAVIISSG